MGKILKGIGIIIGLFIFLALLGAMFGSHDSTVPTTTSSDSNTKTAYTQDGKNFVSKERVEENIKYGYAKPGDYKEMKVPLNTVVVGASVIPDDASKQEEKTTQPQAQTSTPKRTTTSTTVSVQDREWASAALTTIHLAEYDFKMLSAATAATQFAQVRSYCNDLKTIASDGLLTSQSYSVSPEYQEGKKWYEMALQEFYNGCSDVITGIDTTDANKIGAGTAHFETANKYLENSKNSLSQ